MKMFFTGLAAFGLATALSLGAVQAETAGSEAEPAHFPIKHPVQQNWSFSGPFGTYDKAQLQRGLKIYK
jgi:ubiquinol-cytochrome c reductase cytochrome c1 subunit